MHFDITRKVAQLLAVFHNVVFEDEEDPNVLVPIERTKLRNSVRKLNVSGLYTKLKRSPPGETRAMRDVSPISFSWTSWFAIKSHLARFSPSEMQFQRKLQAA